jgi:hypothetical protein
VRRSPAQKQEIAENLHEPVCHRRINGRHPNRTRDSNDPRDLVAADSVPGAGLFPVLSYLDRVNLGFAALTMNKELNFSPTIFSWGAGIFFIGYFLFEVPSNLAPAE